MLFIAAAVAVTGTLTIMALLVRMAKKGRAGSEILAIGLLPLFVCAHALAVAGGGSGIWLACVLSGSGARLVVGIVGGLMLALGLLQIVPAIIGLLAWRKDAAS